MIKDFEDWRLKCMMLVKRWHHIEPSDISYTLLGRLARLRDNIPQHRRTVWNTSAS
jgi:hypothetical protein